MFPNAILALMTTVAFLPTDTESRDIVSVSTTSSPNETLQRQFYQNLGENNYRLSLLEAQVVQTQKLLETERKLNEELRQDLDAWKKKIDKMQTTIDNQQKQTLELMNNLKHNVTGSNGTQSRLFPKSCKELQDNGNHLSGTYYVRPKSTTFKVLCDMNNRGGGWTVFQKRFDGSQDFYLNWNNYKSGFGEFSGEFWLGLEHLYELTDGNYNELLIELTDRDNKTVYAYYYTFGITNEQDGYALKVLNGYDGDAGNLFAKVGMKFSTKDNDQDEHEAVHCAVHFIGAWWYHACLCSNLNGPYLNWPVTRNDVHSGITWGTFHGKAYILQKTRMMVRQR